MGFFSCDPEEPIPFETILEYDSCQYYYSGDRVNAMILRIAFQDGDGNIGLNSYEVGNGMYTGKYRYNLYAHVFDKISDTVYTPIIVPTDTGSFEDLVYAYTIPIMSTAIGAQIKGTFDIEIDSASVQNLQSSRGSKNGILQFQIYMYDRNLNKSNTVVTPDLSIRWKIHLYNAERT